MKQNIFRRLTACMLSLFLIVGLTTPVLAERSGNIVYIRSAQDLVDLAVHCQLDSWSRDKTVILQKDIALNHTEFSGIPTFGGVFDGGGHTISGWTMTEHCAPAGFFNVLQQGALLKDLYVEGTVDPAGSGKQCGGLVGQNGGTISGCTFTGTIHGEQSVGGIAGENTATGTISGCRMQGGVAGKTMTGGIVGENHGVVSNCGSNSYVNTTSMDPSIELDTLNFNFATGFSGLTDANLFQVSTDSGGIAGYSDGMILGCSNHGIVGYQHVGYTVGGIAGRSSGMISGCMNYGEIYGRKDVGGIVGQAEPFVVSAVSNDILSSVRSELHRLSKLVNRATQDAAGSADTVSQRLSKINSDLTHAIDHADGLSQSLVDYVDATTAEINRGGDVLANIADQLSEIADQLPAINRKIERALHRTESAMEDLEKAGADGSAAVKRLKKSAECLTCASELLAEGGKKINSGIKQISEAVTVNDHGSLDVNWSAVESGKTAISDGIALIENGNKASGNRGVGDLLNAAADSAEKALDDLADGTEYLEDAAENLRDAVHTLRDVAADMTDVLEDIRELADYIEGVKPLTFQSLRGQTDDQMTNLHDSVKDLSNQLELLNQEINTSTDRLVADIQAINEQFMVVMDLLLDEAEELEDGTSKRVTDVSDRDIDAETNGKLLRCGNQGTIYGDIDVGGIAGAMGIYNELDPEGDGALGLPSSLRKRYELKTILQSCTNTGNVWGKLNHVGGICGLAKLGVITDCQSYGSIESENGDYVGGVAGGCCTTVRNSYAKCTLSGEQYIGGIIGSALEDEPDTCFVSGCASLVEIPNFTQYAGAIAGRDLGTFQKNYFTSRVLAGIDRMSYAGKAEPLNYEELLRLEGLPAAFRKLNLTFCADGKVIKSLTFDYGDSFDSTVFPEIPQKDGMFGNWDQTDLTALCFDTVVTAEYFPHITALSSAVKREDGRVVFLAEGSFSNEDVLTAMSVIHPFDAAPRGILETLRSYNREITEQWQVTLPDDGSGEATVRYLAPDGKTDHLHIYALQNGKWEQVTCGIVGSYLTFRLPVGENVITVLHASTSWWIWGIVTVFLALMLILTLQYKLLSGFYRKAADRVVKREAAVAAMPPEKRKRRNFLLSIAVLLALLLVTLAVIVYRVPAVKNGVEIYRILSNYEMQDELDMELTIRGTVDDAAYNSTLPMYTTVVSGNRVTCVDLRGFPVYFSGDKLILENGEAYELKDALPDGASLLRNTMTMFQSLDVTMTDFGSERRYDITVGSETTQKLLSVLLPQQLESVAEPDGMTAEVVIKDGKPALLRYIWNGTLSDGSAAALDAELHLHVTQTTEHTLPMEVSTAVAGGLKDAVALSEDMQSVLQALFRMTEKDSLNMLVRASANCGPLILNDEIQMQYTSEAGGELLSLKKGGYTVYLGGKNACTAEGVSAASAMEGVEKFPSVLYQAILKETISHRAVGTKQIYIVDLTDAEAESVVSALAPEALKMNLQLTSGVLRLEMKDGELLSLSAQCSGSAKAALTEIAAAFNGEISFSEPQAPIPVPDAVLQTLFPET